MERKLAAILAADVAGYSRLMAADETGTHERLKALRQTAVEPLIAEHHGRIVKLMGDGALVDFASVIDALECAVAIQKAVAADQAELAADEQIRFRIGINVGDVIIEGDDIYGDGVNVAARLEALAEPGGISVSETVRGYTKDKLDFAFEPMGEQRVKNIPEPVTVYRVLVGHGRRAKTLPKKPFGRSGWRTGVLAATAVLVLVAGGFTVWLTIGSPRSPSSQHDRPSIAVLPFDSFGGDDRQQRLADAFTEDVIAELARSPNLKVIARNSVEAFGGEAVDVREVGRELDVRYVVEGSLELAPERIRVTAQLIETTTGTHLWSERFDRPADDLFKVRDELTTRLVGTLTGYDGPIWDDWSEAAHRKPAQSLQAYDYYLLALTPFRRHDKEGNAEARQLLEKAIGIDPRFARAWNFLSTTHMQDALNGWSDDRGRSWELFHDGARRAAELDPADAFAWLQLGTSYFARRQEELGAEAWERALALGPSQALVNRAIGTAMPIARGVEHAERALELVERALYELDPRHPPFQWLSLGYPLYFAGRYDEAVAAFEKVPNPWLEVRVMLALSYAQAGLEESAARQADEVLKLDPGFSAEAWVDNDIYQPGSSSAELVYEGARKAGLPLCASATEAADFAPGNRLPECETEREAMARKP